jgi:hypothetical protein
VPHPGGRILGAVSPSHPPNPNKHGHLLHNVCGRCFTSGLTGSAASRTAVMPALSPVTTANWTWELAQGSPLGIPGRHPIGCCLCWGHHTAFPPGPCVTSRLTAAHAVHLTTASLVLLIIRGVHSSNLHSTSICHVGVSVSH